jgi:hypothetical protein
LAAFFHLFNLTLTTSLYQSENHTLLNQPHIYIK